MYHHSNRKESVKLLIVNNLSSGFGEGVIYDFVRSLLSDGDEVCIRSTDGTTDLTDTEDASSYDAVVASGGDGDGRRRLLRTAQHRIPILPFPPAGTANILTLNLLAPPRAASLWRLVKSGQTLDLRPREAEVAGKTFGFRHHGGSWPMRPSCMTPNPTKRLLGPMAYFSPPSRTLPEVSRSTLTIDGETIEREGCILP